MCTLGVREEGWKPEQEWAWKEGSLIFENSVAGQATFSRPSQTSHLSAVLGSWVLANTKRLVLPRLVRHEQQGQWEQTHP